MTNNTLNRLILLIAILTLLSSGVYAQQPTAKTFLEIGIQNSENAEYSEAIDEFKHAIQLKPDYDEAYYQMGQAFFNLHRYDESLESYEKAVKLNPDHADAQFALGIITSMLSKYDESINAFKTVIKLNPKYTNAHYSLGNVYFEMENYSDAADAFEQALKIRPKYAEARYQLGLCYINLSRQFIKSAKKEHASLKKLDDSLAKDLMKKIKGK